MSSSPARRGAVVWLLRVTGLSAAEEYRQYYNSRYGYCVDYPVFLQPQPESDSGDGRVFLSRDGRIKQLAYGGYNPTETTLREMYEAQLQELRDQGLKSSHKKLTDTWFVVSWRDGRTLYYVRCAANEGHRGADVKPKGTATVRFEYDQYHRNRMDAVVTHVSRSLRGPDGQGWQG